MQKALSNRYLAFTFLIAIAMSFLTMTAHAAVTGTLSGTVRSTTGSPIVGAQVRILETRDTTKTDSSGSYSFNGIDPGTYTIEVRSATFKTTTLKTTVTQDVIQRLDFSLEKTTVGGITRITVAPINRAKTSTSTVITADNEQKVKSQPNNLYQFPGLLFGQPGITYDPSGYLHIRGSDLFQVGFGLDGVSVIDPITNEFATNIVTVGLKSANFYTNGADASYGGSTGGFINEVTYNGKDFHAMGIKGITELTIGPGSQWNYIGTNTQFGDQTKDGKFDYYISTIRFRNSFPPGFGVVKLPDSQDTVVKFNYYADPNNQVTAFYGHGLEDYEYGPRGPLKIEQPNFNTNPNNVSDYGVDADVQHYDISYVTLRHRFTPQSFISYRYSQLQSYLTQHLEQTNGTFRKQASTVDTHQVDYTNQISKALRLQAGASYAGSHNNYHLEQGVAGPFDDPNSTGVNGYVSRISLTNTAETNIYLGGELKPQGDKLTLDVSVRHSERGYRNMKRLDPFKDNYTDPRVGLAYSPARDLAFHTNFSRFSQFPETRYLAYISPEESGGVFPATARDPAGQQTRNDNRYKPNRLKPSYSENYDLGVDKAFKVFNGNYAISATGYIKKQYDLLTFNLNDYTGTVSNYPRFYDNSGRGQSSGGEFVLSKKANNANDINGFVSYTNSVTRATSSAFDTGYEPYFATFVFDPTITQAQYLSFNKREFPTSYDQRHTVAAVVTKKFGSVFEPSLVLDAGSGFPFNEGNAADGIYGGPDGQHGEKTVGNADFTEVPVILNGNQLSPLTPVVGRSGWHYKFSLNSTFYLTPATSLFFNVDNIFDKLTATVISTTDANGQIYYSAPTAAQPQGNIYYGRGAGSITPIFLSFGFRHKF